MTFEQLGKKFKKLEDESPNVSAVRRYGKWSIVGASPETTREFYKLAAIGAEMMGFHGTKEQAVAYWCNCIYGHQVHESIESKTAQ